MKLELCQKELFLQLKAYNTIDFDRKLIFKKKNNVIPVYSLEKIIPVIF